MSASAAICAAIFPILESGRGDDVFQLVLNVVSLNSVSMLPLWKSFRRSWMICLMDLLPRDICGVGAKISISKWRSSHQNGSALSVVFDWTIAAMICESV